MSNEEKKTNTDSKDELEEVNNSDTEKGQNVSGTDENVSAENKEESENIPKTETEDKKSKTPESGEDPSVKEKPKSAEEESTENKETVNKSSEETENDESNVAEDVVTESSDKQTEEAESPSEQDSRKPAESKGTSETEKSEDEPVEEKADESESKDAVEESSEKVEPEQEAEAEIKKSEEKKEEEEKQVNQEALSEQEKIFATLKEEVESLKTEVDSMSDIKAVRKQMVELKEKILALFLIEKSKKDELIETIQSKFDELKEVGDSLKEKFQKELEENLEKFKPEFESVLKEVQESTNFNDLRNKLISMQDKLKEQKISKTIKDEFFDKIRGAFETVNERQDRERERYEMEISENYLSIKPKVAEAVKFAVETDKYNQARNKLIALQKELKKLKLKKDHLDELFGVIRKAFENVNARQDKERAEFKEKAQQEYKELKPEIDEAVEFAENSEDYEEARSKLIEAQKNIKGRKLSKEHRDELYGKIREVFNKINDIQNESKEEFIEECRKNFAELEVKVNEAAAYIDFTNDLNDIRNGLLEVQDEVKIVKLTRAERNELFKRIRLAFEKFDEKRNEFIKGRKLEKKQRLEKELEKKKHKMEEKEEAKPKVKEEVDKIEDKVEKIEKDIDKLS